MPFYVVSCAQQEKAFSTLDDAYTFVKQVAAVRPPGDRPTLKVLLTVVYAPTS